MKAFRPLLPFLSDKKKQSCFGEEKQEERDFSQALLHLRARFIFPLITLVIRRLAVYALISNFSVQTLCSKKQLRTISPAGF